MRLVGYLTCRVCKIQFPSDLQDCPSRICSKCRMNMRKYYQSRHRDLIVKKVVVARKVCDPLSYWEDEELTQKYSDIWSFV